MGTIALFGFLLLLAAAPSPSLGSDGSVTDDTGCPAAFKTRCQCGLQRYKYWKPDQQLYVVNCTGAGFTSTFDVIVFCNALIT